MFQFCTMNDHVKVTVWYFQYFPSNDTTNNLMDDLVNKPINDLTNDLMNDLMNKIDK